MTDQTSEAVDILTLQLLDPYVDVSEDCVRTLLSALAVRDALLDKAGVALEPFCDAARDADERGGVDDNGAPDELPIDVCSDEAVTIGHCRAARAVAAEIKALREPR